MVGGDPTLPNGSTVIARDQRGLSKSEGLQETSGPRMSMGTLSGSQGMGSNALNSIFK